MLLFQISMLYVQLFVNLAAAKILDFLYYSGLPLNQL
jgi:hypothetical protein